MNERSGQARARPGGFPFRALAWDILYGALVAAGCTALSFLLALAGFGRLYYLAVFLPFFMLACLLVAWFLYLKDDGFIRPAGTSGVGASAAELSRRPPSKAFLSEGPEGVGPQAGPDLSLFAPRGDELVPRKSPDELVHQSASGARRPEGDCSSGRRGTSTARHAFFWAAVLLGLLAAALYSWAGVGAGYFLPVTP